MLVCAKNGCGWLAAALLIVLACSPRAGWTQAVEAALRGKASPNAEITVRNTATGLTRHTRAAADGSYSIVGLPPGRYRVDAGAGTETNVTLTVAATITLDLQPQAPTEELATVTVKTTRPTEVKTSEIATLIPQVQIETLPQITRNFLEFADTVPGMVFIVDKNGNTSLRGGAQNDIRRSSPSRCPA
jgi:hypothetical protein